MRISTNEYFHKIIWPNKFGPEEIWIQKATNKRFRVLHNTKRHVILSAVDDVVLMGLSLKDFRKMFREDD